MNTFNLRDAWNRLSADYQTRHAIPTDSAHYGPWAPLENELRLLGDVHGRSILEIGCGGGQCTIAFAKQGATATGVDLSDEQLAFARRLAAAEGVDVQFVQGSADALNAFEDFSQDFVFSAYAFQYVANIDRCLCECHRVLRQGGQLVFSLDHPFRDCFLDEEEDEIVLYPARSYFDNSPMYWSWIIEDPIRMRSFHHTVAQWFAMLGSAGFTVRKLLEPEAPAQLVDEIWPTDDALSSLQHIPQTIIFVVEKA